MDWASCPCAHFGDGEGDEGIEGGSHHIDHGGRVVQRPETVDTDDLDSETIANNQM